MARMIFCSGISCFYLPVYIDLVDNCGVNITVLVNKVNGGGGVISDTKVAPDVGRKNNFKTILWCKNARKIY